MGTGIRAEVRIESPSACPIARLSAATGVSSDSITKSTSPVDPHSVTQEFTLDRRLGLESLAVDLDVETGPTEVFSYGERIVYRIVRERDVGCPCECVERYDCPVVDVYTEGGSVDLVFHAPDMERLQSIIGTLRERYPGLDVRRLLRSQRDHGEQRLVIVDRNTLTDRQTEVLETAHRMGYFEHPKDANAGEVAEALEITTSTFTEHLAAAQTKLLDAILDA